MLFVSNQSDIVSLLLLLALGGTTSLILWTVSDREPGHLADTFVGGNVIGLAIFICGKIYGVL